MNSEFRGNLYDQSLSDNYLACMRFIDWKRGTPYVFHLSDYDDLINSPYLYGRKFDLTVDSVIVDKLMKFQLSRMELPWYSS